MSSKSKIEEMAERLLLEFYGKEDSRSYSPSRRDLVVMGARAVLEEAERMKASVIEGDEYVKLKFLRALFEPDHIADANKKVEP